MKYLKAAHGSRIHLLLILFIFSECRQVKISDNLVDEGQECFVIRARNATYYYQKTAGGFSSIIDKEGNDWISFARDTAESYPKSAASSYRGLPNLVFGSADGGAGHPGFDKCYSEQISGNQIRTYSRSEKWAWTWTFHPDYASVTIEKVDPFQSYWFLYEGTPGGEFKPSKQYWGTDKGGPLRSQPDYYKGVALYENWQWIYFGHTRMNRIFVLIQAEPDELTDTYSYLGNTDEGVSSPDGMVVFGFGRAPDAKPLLSTEGEVFHIGFIEQKVQNKEDHSRIDNIIDRIILKAE